MRKIALSIIVGVCILGLTACQTAPAKADLEIVRLVLDWTPNTNHTGIYVAQELGYYKEAGIDLEIIQPPEGGALSLLGAGNAQYAIDFQESLGPALASANPLPVEAIAAIISHNTSGILSLKDSNIQSPKDLEGKKFACWTSPLVDAIIKDIVEADGGDFSKVQMVPLEVTDVVSALQSGVDAVWIYYAWDGIAVEQNGLQTNYMSFPKLNPVFDFYTPVLVTNSDYANSNPDKVKSFVAATTKGYEYAIQNPDEAADILLKNAPELDAKLVHASQIWLADQYQADAKTWGMIDESRWKNFYEWMYNKNILEKDLGTAGFTNEFLPR